VHEIRAHAHLTSHVMSRHRQPSSSYDEQVQPTNHEHAQVAYPASNKSLGTGCSKACTCHASHNRGCSSSTHPPHVCFVGPAGVEDKYSAGTGAVPHVPCCLTTAGCPPETSGTCQPGTPTKEDRYTASLPSPSSPRQVCQLLTAGSWIAVGAMPQAHAGSCTCSNRQQHDPGTNKSCTAAAVAQDSTEQASHTYSAQLKIGPPHTVCTHNQDPVNTGR
jgi:hypothetical protein